jgi:hypothetical protein
MLLELRIVGRKTPGDGKLEVTDQTARRLAILGNEILLRVGAQTGTAMLSSMRCSCGKAAGTDHQHHFLEGELVRTLLPGATVAIELIDGVTIEIALPHDL